MVSSSIQRYEQTGEIKSSEAARLPSSEHLFICSIAIDHSQGWRLISGAQGKRVWFRMHFTGRSPRSISTDDRRSFGSPRSSGRILTIGRWRSWEPISTPCPRTSRSSLWWSSQKNTLSGKPPSEPFTGQANEGPDRGHPFCRAFIPTIAFPLFETQRRTLRGPVVADRTV